MIADGAKWRWWLAYKLDKLPSLCWAGLVSWALHRQPLSECRIDWICHNDLAANGACYCGKLRAPSPREETT